MNKLLDKTIQEKYARCSKSNERNEMSRIKAALPEGFSILTGDELDGSPYTNEIEVGFAMRDLASAIKVLEKHKPFSEYAEIDSAQAKLAELLVIMDKPF